MSERVQDGLLAIAVAIVAAVFTVPDVVATVLAVALSAPLAIRRTHPKTALATATAAAVAHAVLLPELTVAVVTVPVLVYSFARWEERRLAWAALGIALAGAVAGPVTRLAGHGVQAVLVTVLWYAAGVVVVHVAGTSGRERAYALQRAARAEERAEIAREVHDVVAHSLAMIAVQAEGGTARPEKAPEVLGTIAEESRKALNEIRDLVGVLRRVPDVRELVGKLGDRATLHIGHHQPSLTVYRVVQEALTNFLRHAGPEAKVEVVISEQQNQVDVVVRDDGRGAEARTDGRGNGLAAMRERVESQGGTVTARATGQGFEVHAVLRGPR